MKSSLSIGPRTLLNDCNHSATANIWRSAITSQATLLHNVPSLIALANVANRLSAFMPLQTAAPRTTRSNVQP